MNIEALFAVADLIEAEDRFNMNAWVAQIAEDGELYEMCHPSPSLLFEDCCTVGCVAGWTCALAKTVSGEEGWVDYESGAKEFLGLTEREAHRLFFTFPYTYEVKVKTSIWQDVIHDYGLKVDEDDALVIPANVAANVLRRIAYGDLVL